jgi:CDP-glycerol glycerophosphotransferase
MIVFEALHGKRYTGNVKAVYEQMLSDDRYSDFRFIWAFSNVEAHAFLKENPRTQVIQKGGKKYYRYYATARFWVNDVSVPDFLKPGKNQIYIETWHGTPLKRLGCDITTNSDPRQSAARMHRRYRSKGKKITYFLSPSPYYSEKLTSAFQLNKYHNEKAMTETGYPRNDALYHYTIEDIQRIKERLKIPADKKTILYTPTWRDSEFSSDNGFEYKEMMNPERFTEVLGSDYILLFRAHHQVGLSDIIKESASVIDVSSVDDINDLYIISDLMITDYSSTMYDYANLKRPMVFYMYDLDE